MSMEPRVLRGRGDKTWRETNEQKKKKKRSQRFCGAAMFDDYSE